MVASTPTDPLAQQLANLAHLAERVASPDFKRGFRASVRARALAAGSTVSYRDAQGRLVQEWPATGRVEVLAE